MPAGALVIVKAGWIRTGNIIVPTCSGGGLAWPDLADHDQQAFDSGSGFSWGVAIFSAPAPAGLAGSTVLTIGGGPYDFGVMIGAEYLTGGDLGASRKAASVGNNVLGADAAWTTRSLTTPEDNCALLAAAWQDNATNSTADSPWAELYETHDATLQWDFVSQWREAASAGSYAATGTWSGGSPDAYAAAVVAYRAELIGNTLAWIRA